MFGLLTPCTHTAAKYGLNEADWRAHMCGLCLGLRDGHGQLARTATNTDALVLNVLTEVQATTAPARTIAAPCALRGMQRAAVARADSPGVRLAATASLLLGAAKIRDHIDDGDTGLLARRPMGHISQRWYAAARASAARIDLDIEPLLAALGRQAYIEGAVRNRAFPQHTGLAELTAPAQLCAAELFAHSSILAGRPERAAALREAGWHFGRIAHLADAIEDLDEDRRRGRFNPLLATDTSADTAYELLRESDRTIRRALHQAELAHAPAVRWIFLDPLRTVLRKFGRATGAVCTTGAHSCRSGRADERAQQAPLPPPPDQLPHPDDPNAPTEEPPQPPPPRPPSFWGGIAIVCGVYCTGAACCTSHQRPCTGEQREPWCRRMDCGDCCDCCDCSCDCCSNDCCGCDCCGCDCSC